VTVIVFLKQLLQLIFGTQKKQADIQEPQQTNDDYIGGISFKLLPNEMVDVSCYIPEVHGLSSDEMIAKAETYAKLLLHVNEGLLMENIILFINNTIKKTDNIDDKLFLENVLVFWGVLHIEHGQKKQKNSNQPVIRPLSAFHSRID
jgi:hypothetical protein